MTRDRKFLLGSISFIFGVFLFPFVSVGSWVLFLIAGAAIACYFVFPGEKNALICLAVLGCAAGLLRFDFCEKISDVDEDLQKLNGSKVSLLCEVVAMPEFKNGKQQITLQAKDKNFPHGRILASASAYGDYNYGDTVNFRGTLKIPESFDGFDYRKYLFQKNIYFVSYYPKIEKVGSGGNNFYAAIYDFRKKADSNITKILSSPQGNILSAMILGMNSDEIKNVMDNFNKTGTSHIIVVSGSHLVIVAAILMFLLLAAGVNRNNIFFPVIFGMAAFVILSGSGSSAIRSGIMAFVFLFAVRIGRAKNAINALIFSAVLMIFINPYILTGDVSFQLSFLSTFGLIYISPIVERKLVKIKEYGGIKEMLITTFSAQLATLPVIVANFGQFSLLSFLANILILPTVPVLMIGGFLFVGLSFLSFTAAQILSWPIYLILSYHLAIVNFFANTDIGLIKF